ncbi:flagellar export chaperone FlgN [Halomonas sp. HNIBRBA4712]|uniref:flagellar export chaperone FlgN n=1 Tax=Halomonas sp. HNIBRBA4712 TaxID=3373087 RepID=UPI003745FD2E
MSLSRLLSEQHQRLDELLELLSSEQAQLAKGEIDGEALATTADAKQTLLSALDRMETLRRSTQTRLGYDDDANGAFEAAADAQCEQSWTHFLDKTERAARMNALTGEMLSMRMQHNQDMLNYIQQIAEKTLYQPNGRNKAPSSRLNTSA